MSAMFLQAWRIHCYQRWRSVESPSWTRTSVGTCIEPSRSLGRPSMSLYPLFQLPYGFHGEDLKGFQLNHPVLHLSSCAETIFSKGGHFFLQGKDLSEADDFSRTLLDFWEKFSTTHPDFVVPNELWDHAIPVCLHGDEGRGRLKQPVMVMSVQPLLLLILVFYLQV